MNAVNATEHLAAERAFLPAVGLIDLMREEGVPMFSLESCAPLSEFDAIGITLPHEFAATNVLEVLDLSGLPLRAVDRAQNDPIVLGGGPASLTLVPMRRSSTRCSSAKARSRYPRRCSACASAVVRVQRVRISFARLRRFLDATFPRCIACGARKRRSVRVPWVEPVEPGVPEHIEKRLFSGFSESSGWEPCIVPYTECVHDRLSVEVLRGCARGCRFCQAGMMYRPVRERSADNVVSSVLEGLADTGYDEVSLTSLSSTDHSRIADILTKLNHACDGKGVRISLPSQRLDSFGVDMAELVAGQKKGGLTFAPEAGTQRLRDVINKNVTEDDLFGAIDAAFKAGWRRCKLYFMIGLPTETDEDIKGIASLVQRAYDRAKAAVPPEHRGNVRVSASVALFVPEVANAFPVGRPDSPRGGTAPRELAAQQREVQGGRYPLARSGDKLRRGRYEPRRAAGGRLGGGRMAPRGTLRCVDRALLGGRLAEGCVRRGNRSCGNRAGAVGNLRASCRGRTFPRA